MSNSLRTIKESFAAYRLGLEQFQKGAGLLGRGPADSYFDTLQGYVEGLFGRFAPFHAGDRVEIIQAPKTDGTHWHASRHFLIVGSRGEVQSVDYRKDRFCADVVFDDESWIDAEGVIRPIINKHTFRLWEQEIRKAEAK